MNIDQLNRTRLGLREKVKGVVKDEIYSSFDRRCLHIESAFLNRNPFLWELHHELIADHVDHEINCIYLLNKESGRKVYVETKSVNSKNWNESKMAYNNAMKKIDEVLKNIA